mgnify:FL=1
MLTKRIIILLTYKDGVLFRTKNFKPDYRYTDNFVSNTYVDEIVIINVSTDTSKENEKKFLSALTKISKNCFVPITVGGKINNLEQIKQYQNLGADKILLGSLTIQNTNLFKKIVAKYGSQFVIASIDYKKKENFCEVYIENGKTKIEMSFEEYFKFLLNLNPGEILINSIDRDGSLNGFDLEICKNVKKISSVPIIAAGGFGNWTHATEALKIAGLDGICTSNIFHFTEKSLYGLKEFLKKENIKVR